MGQRIPTHVCFDFRLEAVTSLDSRQKICVNSGNHDLRADAKRPGSGPHRSPVRRGPGQRPGGRRPLGPANVIPRHGGPRLNLAQLVQHFAQN